MADFLKQSNDFSQVADLLGKRLANEQWNELLLIEQSCMPVVADMLALGVELHEKLAKNVENFSLINPVVKEVNERS